MKILQLAPRVPFPEDDGGKIGIANITKELSKLGADITLLYLFSDEADLEIPEYAYDYAEIIPVEHNTRNSISKIARSIITQKSLFIQKHSSKYVFNFVDHFLKGRDFDIIHCDHSSMVPLGLYCQSILKCPIALRLHNLEWTIWQRYADSLSSVNPKRPFIQNQAKLLKEYEASILPKMDISFAITDVDKKIAESMAPNAKITIASAGVNLDEWIPDANVSRNSNEMIHATVYRWIHNLDAITWFADKVFPLISEFNPDIRLTLLGKSAPDWLAKYHEKFDLLGYVPEVQSHLNRAGIYIAPLFVGGGIRIKILEAMAMELPVIASPVAAEGINASESDGLFIANNEEEFAKHIKLLTSNLELRNSAGKAARKYIELNYSWSASVKIIFEEYKKLLNI